MHTLTFVSPHRRVDAADGALEVSRAALEASRDALQGAEASAGRGQEAARADEARDAHERSILALEMASLETALSAALEAAAADARAALACSSSRPGALTAEAATAVPEAAAAPAATAAVDEHVRPLAGGGKQLLSHASAAGPFAPLGSGDSLSGEHSALCGCGGSHHPSPLAPPSPSLGDRAEASPVVVVSGQARPPSSRRSASG